MAVEHTYHISLLCRVQQDREHDPCSGTCDRDAECFEPCMCTCHPKPQAVIHDHTPSWHGDQFRAGGNSYGV